MERGGPTSQSGILYQNSVAALYLGRLCDGTPRPDKDAVVSVRVEAPSAVDDIVVTYKDGHRSFVQAKENVRDADEAWRRLWKAFEKQFWSADFHLGKDRLVLQVGEIHDEHHDLREICNRTSGSVTHAEWLSRLTKSQQSLLKRIKSSLEPEHSAADEEVLSFLRHIDVHIRPLGDIEQDMLRDWIPPTNKTQLELFKLLRDAAADASRKRLSLSTTELRSELAAQCGVSFVSQPSFNDLLEAVKACGASLKQHRHTFGNTGAHLKRPIVETIISWVLDPEKQTDDVGILVDRAGVGKTVVMQDVLSGLEAAGVNVLAIKADLLAAVNTTEDLRQHLQLPDTVERVVRRLAEQSTSVLLIDQIDALSLSLARDQRTLDIVLDLVARARMIPGARVLLSCRTFDLNNSSKLRNLKSKKFEVTELTEAEVREVILNVGHLVDFDHLSEATRQLLRTPLHLDLFLRVLEERSIYDINARTNAIENLQDLYTSLWQTVIRRAEPSATSVTDRELVLKLITDEMDRAMRTTVPQSLLSSQSPDLDRAAQWLASQGILVPNRMAPGLEWAYLHQTFFDYCYAKNFLDERKSLFEIVRNGEQGLFARPQIIHVLEFLRGVDPSQYLKEVWTFLNASSSELRFHLRDHVLRWFGSVLSPTDDEWVIAQRLLVDVDRRSGFLRAAEGNTGWFYRLKAHMQRSLNCDANEVIEKETLPYLYSMVNANQGEIIDLLRPYQTKSDTWKARVHNITRLIRDWKSEEAISLFEERFREAPIDKLGEFYETHEIARTHPRAACRLIRIALDRILDDHLSTHEVNGVSQFYLLRLPPALEVLNGSTITDALGKVAKQEPRYFLDTMLPWLIRVVTVKPELNDESYTFASDALSHSWYGSPYVVHHEINRGFIDALTALGNISKTDFDHVARQIKALNYDTPQRYLVNAYSNVVSSMTDDALEFLTSDRRRLDLGDHQQYDTRQLIKAMVPYLRDDQFRLLESAILSYEPLKKWRGIGALRWRGLEKLYLLQCLPEKRLSSLTLGQLRELERKFPGIQASEDPGTGKSGFVGPPIPDDLAQKMSDKSWLRAMTKYKGGIQHKDFFKGGAQEQGAVLSRLAKEKPERFFRLAMRAPLDTDESYICALISGLSQSTSAAERPFDVIRRFKDSAARYVKQAIAAAIEKRADDGIPDDLVALLDSYLEDQPGEDETWWRREENE